MSLAGIVLVVGGTLTGLLAGVLYAFPVAFVPALRDLKSSEHIAAMQALNRRIENPVFFLSFFGPVVLLPLAAYLLRDTPEFWLLVAASILHIVGAVGITAARHIPWNRELARVDARAISEEESERIRADYQGPGTPWMRWHTVRTLAAIAATALVFIACLTTTV